MDYYKVLGVPRTADQREIREAYLKQLKFYHPDVYRGDADYATKKTREIIEAYEALSSEELMLEYELGEMREEKNRRQAHGNGAAVIAVIIAVFVGLLVVAAAMNGEKYPPSELIGEWAFDECICYKAGSWDAVDRSFDGVATDAKVSILEDGKFELQAYGKTAAGSWEVDETARDNGYDVIKLEYEDEADAGLVSYFGNALQLNMQDSKSMYCGFALDKKTDCVLWFYRVK